METADNMHNELVFQVPAQVQKVSTMSHRSLRIVVDTQENLTDEEMARLASLHEKTGWWCFLPEERRIDTLDVAALPEMTYEKDEKSPAQRLRGVLYVKWEQDGKNGAFIDYYQRTMEKIIDSVKEKLT